MIRFHRVHSHGKDVKIGRRLGLRGVSAVLPKRCNVGVTGDDPHALTAFLHLAAGSEIPDKGVVVADSVRRSPIVNAGGTPAGWLVPQLSALENLRAFANLNGVDLTALARAVEVRLQPGLVVRDFPFAISTLTGGARLTWR